LTGSRQVCSATGLAVKTLDLDCAQNTLTIDFLAYADPLKFFRGAEPDGHDAVLKNDVVRTSFGLFHVTRDNRWRVKVDGRDVTAEMKGHGGKPEQLKECRRKQVLAGVLLHVVDATWPIDGASHLAWFNRGGRVMHDTMAVVSIRHFDHIRTAQLSRIVRLPARGGVKRGAIEDDAPSLAEVFRIGFARQDIRVELAQKRVVVIKAVGQFPSSQNARIA
jgi:hypothetical protein